MGSLASPGTIGDGMATSAISCTPALTPRQHDLSSTTSTKIASWSMSSNPRLPSARNPNMGAEAAYPPAVVKLLRAEDPGVSSVGAAPEVPEGDPDVVVDGGPKVVMSPMMTLKLVHRERRLEAWE